MMTIGELEQLNAIRGDVKVLVAQVADLQKDFNLSRKIHGLLNQQADISLKWFTRIFNAARNSEQGRLAGEAIVELGKINDELGKVLKG